MIKQQFRGWVFCFGCFCLNSDFFFFFGSETTLRNLINGIEGEITPQSVVKTLMEFAADVTTDKV